MGLDMYLRAECYLSPRLPENVRALHAQVASLIGITPCEESPSITVVVNIGYWRKANAIHGYFLRCLKDGADDCRPIAISRDELVELRLLCLRLLASLNVEEAREKLPPQDGFFFGSSEISDSYWADLANTVAILDRALALPHDSTDYSYRASW